MLQRLRYRVQGQEGFTLIELLVVILIIGILAAVAIPTFLSQTGKAKDANVQANLNTVQTAEASYNTTSNGYVNATADVSKLENIEPTIKQFASGLSLAAAAPTSVTDPSGGTVVNFSAEITSPSGVVYDLTSYQDGGVAYTCTVPANTNAGACKTASGGSGSGTWGSGS